MNCASNTLFSDRKKIAGDIEKIAVAILADFPGKRLQDVAFIGIQQKGVPFASRIVSALERKSGVAVPLGTLDISMYRDDIGMRKSLPQIRETEILFDINDRILILADDVLQSGRTIRAALDAVNDYGRPGMIKLAVLIDRGMREFPIRADYVGENCGADGDMRVSVSWSETDGVDAVYLLPKGNATTKSKAVQEHRTPKTPHAS